MLFILIIIISLGSGYLGRKHGFVAMWTLGFNAMISIYLGLMLSPTIIGSVKQLNTSQYYHGLTVFVLAAIIFVITHKLVNTYFSRIFDMPMPPAFNNIGGAVLGFLAAFFICYFVVFAIGITPVSKNPIVKKIAGDEPLAKSAEPSVTRICRTVDSLSFQVDCKNCQRVIKWYITGKKTSKNHEPTSDEPINQETQETDEL